MGRSTEELCFCKLTDLLFDWSRKTEVYEHILVERVTPHDVLWFDVSVHYFQGMEETQLFFEFLDFERCILYAPFYCKLYTVFVKDYVEP